jgi:hypothetical protein
MTPSYDGVTVQHPDNNPDPTGETDAITITGGVQPLWNAALGRYEDARYGAISSDRHLDLSSYGGYVQLSGSEANNGDGIELFTDSGYMVMGSATHPDGAAMFDMHVIPAESGTYSLGASSVAKRWKYVYLNNNPNVSSDERIKRDIEPIRGADALLAAIPAYQFRMADDPDALHYGTTWQAVRDALAAADINGAAILGDDPDDDRQVHGLLYGEFTGLLIAALAEHRDRIAALEARLDAPETAG